MAFQSSMSRLAAVTFVLLSLGFLVQASPIAAPTPTPGNEVATIEERTGKNCYGEYCYGGLDLLTIMLRLQAAINIKLVLLNLCRLKGGDYTPIILDIEGLLCAAIDAIRSCKLGLLDLLTGRLLIIAKIWFSIAISITTYCGRWASNTDFDDFLCLVEKLDLALKNCLCAIFELGGMYGGFYGSCFGL
ncbi:hypothetical protein RSOL_271290 [Rhizoctonia solani AG-3 Rhs1AP]|uniref:Transmembrane protein n=1 Tax=Rhizoctonia solani AG-3 Rhs1AP TaxID=1086054 RepID=A0A0A1UI67_9AGAM|nr:hypothetical protein RSOL_271290 [Rhizoctonia solani AG-3 Rhs1AP]